MRYDKALHQATKELVTTSPTARLDAELLLAAVCGVTRMHLLAEWDTELSPDQAVRFVHGVRRRTAGEPVAYIVGIKEFYGRPFKVDRRVLVPRPETELLVEQAVAWSKQRTTTPVQITIADIGTGSGCIAITLALEVPTAIVTATDVSLDALAVAGENVVVHHVADRVTLLQGDSLAPLATPVDMLVSNPPYTILAEVESNVHQWEPHLALDGHGPQGLAVIETLLADVPDCLRPGGVLFMEIGAWQGPAVVALAEAAFAKAKLRVAPLVLNDLAGLPRLLVVQK